MVAIFTPKKAGHVNVVELGYLDAIFHMLYMYIHYKHKTKCRNANNTGLRVDAIG